MDALDILEMMDRLHQAAAERGREPQHWIIRQTDWREIGARFRAGLTLDFKGIGPADYKGIPIHFSKFAADEIVGLVDREGKKVEAKTR